MENIHTTQGRRKIFYEGLFYVRQKYLAGGWISYECERRRLNSTCKGKIKVNGDNVAVSRQHTHPPDPIRREVLRIRDNFRMRAQNTQEVPRQVLLNGLAGVNDDTVANIYTLSITCLYGSKHLYPVYNMSIR